jgi:hypothetical protein
MSPPGRPKGEYRRTQSEGTPVSDAGVLHRRAASLSLLVAAAALGPAPRASAVPPPTVRPDVAVELQPGGPEQVVRDTVRAYQPVPIAVAAQAGDRLLLRLVDVEQVLVLGTEASSGLIGMNGARPGPDGLLLRLAETGTHRVLVLMSADAARAGRAASFELGLRLLR